MKPGRLKRFFVNFLCFSLCIFLVNEIKAQDEKAKKIILVTQIVEHPALNAVRQGIQDVLKAHADSTNIDIRIIYENAQGSIPLAGQLAKRFSAEEGDVVVGISTPSAQTLKSALRGEKPLVFSALTDPVAAKLVRSVETPGDNVTGVTDLPPFAKQMSFIQETIPAIKRLGIIYNPGEANAVASLEFLTQVLESLGIELVASAINRSSEVAQATKRLLKDVDAIYIPNDNTVVSGLDAIVRVCHEAKMPLFAADILLVEKGLVGMVGFDYYSIGQQTGNLVKRILEGEEAGEIPVQNPTNLKLILNPEAGKKMGISFSEEAMKKADELVPKRSER